MSKPFVDLLVPTFNSEKTVAKTLESLLSQSYKNVKITIFDNQSNDKTQDIVSTYADRGVELVVNESNLGGEGNFNRCIEAARNPYFCICHSDDIYDSRFVEAQVMALENNPLVTVSFFHATRIDSENKLLGERFLPEELEDRWQSILTFQDVLILSLKYGNIFTCPTAFFRTQVIKDKHLKFEGSKYKSSSDLGLWLNLASYGDVLFHNAPLLQYRESDVSFSFALKKARTHRHDFFLVIDDFLKNHRIELDHHFSQWNQFLNFLIFKDQMLQVLNVLKTKKWIEWPEETFRISSIIPLLFYSNWHLVFGLKALGIYIVSRPFKIIRSLSRN